MKKLLTIMLGLSIALGSVALAQDTGKTEQTSKKKNKKSKKSKKEETTKSGGSL